MVLNAEGVYVRNIKTGAVETVIGRTYLLGPEEELWEKQLSSDVERLLSFPQNDSKGMKLHENMDFVPEKRDKTKARSSRAAASSLPALPPPLLAPPPPPFSSRSRYCPCSCSCSSCPSRSSSCHDDDDDDDGTLG
jgi:hypothetical protein